MLFIYPDCQDMIAPSFDFQKETRKENRNRQREDLYPHEYFPYPPYDGIIISKSIVEGYGTSGRFSEAQRLRLLRTGAPKYLRTENLSRKLLFYGDCGAFTYIKDKYPPFTVDSVINFYENCEFDYGMSVDHVILGYQNYWHDSEIPEEYKDRQKITLEYANEFFNKTYQKVRFSPIGVAQGWDPISYAFSVKELQKMGYQYIALGGLVPLKTEEIISVLEEVKTIRNANTKLHLLGISRYRSVEQFQKLGVVSIDSTSPMRQAFKDEYDNYYTSNGNYIAIRLPCIEGNTKLRMSIRSGQISQEDANRIEKTAKEKLELYINGKSSIDDVLEPLLKYEKMCGVKKNHYNDYKRVLTEKPWEKCNCRVCQEIGYHTILLRGNERNKRRGFHNVWVFYNNLKNAINK